MPFKEPRYNKVIQIEITNACNYECCHCSRLVGHHKKPFFMSLPEIENALKTLEDFPGHVGIMGGEPTLHPKFKEICKLLQKYVFVKARRELWTNGYKWKEYKKIIEKTFYPELISYNQHEEQQPCWHQPATIAIQEVFNGSVSGIPKGGFTEDEDNPKVKDATLMWKIINNCWVQQRWSASVTPMGAYFCETAAARAMLYSNPYGMPIGTEWWKHRQEHWEYQRELCKDCSMCLPMPMIANDKQVFDEVSSGVLQKLSALDSPKAAAGKCKTVSVEALRAYYKGHAFEPETEYRERGSFKDFPDWKPWRYRQAEEIKHDPKDVLKAPGTATYQK